MNVEFVESFLNDIRSIRDKSVVKRLKSTIESVENADSLNDVVSVKKMHGGKDYFRIRIGDFRVGIKLNGDKVVFVRFLNRKEIYRYFP